MPRFEVGRIPLGKIQYRIKYWYQMYVFEQVLFLTRIRPMLKIDKNEIINRSLVAWRMQNLEITALFTFLVIF